mmetsp:Transcript_950/g.1909  ORF Transcript_950/g.1909 Transcript_950/m.1909 type:complete len:115 (+) Transcript_950:954-1298(+)
MPFNTTEKVNCKIIKAKTWGNASSCISFLLKLIMPDEAAKTTHAQRRAGSNPGITFRRFGFAGTTSGVSSLSLSLLIDEQYQGLEATCRLSSTVHVDHVDRGISGSWMHPENQT